MRTSARLGLTALIAALLLASALGTASARNFSNSEQNLRTTWSRMEFVGSLTVRCPMTLEGSLHSRTIPKIARLLIGAVTRVAIKNESCTGGTALVQRLPWHFTYEGFRGTLPNITAVIILLARFQYGLNVEIIGTRRTCLYGTSTDNIGAELGNNAERLATWLVPIAGANTAHLVEGSTTFPECPAEGRMTGSATDGLTRILNTGGQIKITLI